MPHLLSSVANHLWQSTLFAAAVAALCYALRHNSARLRHALWLSASLKFFVPFWLLVFLGSRVPAPIVPPVMPQASVEQLAFSFAPMPLLQLPAQADAPWWPLALATLWGLGSITVLFAWSRRWLIVHRALSSSEPAPIAAPLPVLSSGAAIEPGVFGIVRPVLLLPAGIGSRLSTEELDSILAHELAHVRRRDNLTSALHMLVEAIFWFHPLVWYIGTRLIDERERACDDEVLRQGLQPQTYAEGILNVCKHYLESPLPCASGVTGADLKLRIREILNNRRALRLTRARKLVLACAGLVAFSIPIFIGALNAQSKTDRLIFEVASIRPSDPDSRGLRFADSPDNGIRATGVSLRFLVQFAYDVEDFQISGGPSWLRTDRFDISAKAANPDMTDLDEKGAERVQRARAERLRERIRTLLADRFNLVVRRDSKEASVYELVQAKGGHKLKPPTEEHGISRNRGFISGEGAPLRMLAKILSSVVGRPVVDRTGVEGKFDFKLEWSEETVGAGKDGSLPVQQDSSGPSIFAAIQEQLGLRLESTKAPIEMIVIDRAEKPSAN